MKISSYSMLQARADKLMPKVAAKQEEVSQKSKRKFTNKDGPKNKKPKRRKLTIVELEESAKGYSKLNSVQEQEKMDYQMKELLESADDNEEEDLEALYGEIEALEQSTAATAKQK